MSTPVEKVASAIALVVALAVVGAANVLLTLHRWATRW